jgi:hypothetical protein
MIGFSRASLAVIALLSMVGLLSAPFADAQELPLETSNKAAATHQTANPSEIANAVSLYLTKSGEAYLGQNVEALLGNSGFSFREGYFPQFTYKAEKPLPLEKMASSSPQAGQLVRQIKKLLSDWFVGLEIKDPQPWMVLSNIGYRASFKRLSLSTDREAHKRLGRKSGAVFILQAEIDRLEAGGESILVQDLKNRELVGTIGALQPMLSLSPKSKALTLRVPFFVDVTQKGLVVEALGGQSNFAATDLRLTYKKLLVPEIAMVVNGQRFPLKTDRLVETFEEMKPKLLEHVKDLADQLVRESFATLVNDAIKGSLPEKVEQITRLNPPGAPTPAEGAVVSPVTPFTWTLRLSQMGLGQHVLGLTLSSSVEDPEKSSEGAQLGFDPALAARGPVSLAGSDPSTYDLALSVNRGLINRILQLSYARGYFAEFETEPGNKLKFFATPTIDADPATANRDSLEPQLRLHLAIASPVKGMVKNALIRGEVRFYADVIGRLVNVPDEKGLRLRLEAIDLDSVRVLDESLTSLGRGILRGRVVSGVKDELRSSSDKWKREPLVIPGELPLPPEIMGETFIARGMRMDKNGYLVMFLDFAQKAQGEPK